MNKRFDIEHIYLEELALGDLEAFRYFFMAYFPKMKAFINHFVYSEAIAEDLSQDIFEKIWLNREYASNLKSFNSYIYRMAKNMALNYIEHKNIEDNYITSHPTFQSEVTIEEEIDAKELELIVQLTVEKMPEQCRRVFKMSRIDGLKNIEIAEKLNLSKRTVEAHLNHALKQIKKAIAAMYVF